MPLKNITGVWNNLRRLICFGKCDDINCPAIQHVNQSPSNDWIMSCQIQAYSAQHRETAHRNDEAVFATFGTQVNHEIHSCDFRVFPSSQVICNGLISPDIFAVGAIYSLPYWQ